MCSHPPLPTSEESLDPTDDQISPVASTCNSIKSTSSSSARLSNAKNSLFSLTKSFVRLSKNSAGRIRSNSSNSNILSSSDSEFQSEMSSRSDFPPNLFSKATFSSPALTDDPLPTLSSSTTPPSFSTDTLIKSRSGSFHSNLSSYSSSFSSKIQSDIPIDHSPPLPESSSRRGSSTSLLAQDHHQPPSTPPIHTHPVPAQKSSTSLIEKQLALHIPFATKSFFTSFLLKQTQSFNSAQSSDPPQPITHTQLPLFQSPKGYIPTTDNRSHKVLVNTDLPSSHPYSLPLVCGDIINVLLLLDNGWADGINQKNQRGWFPISYTCPSDPDSGHFRPNDTLPELPQQPIPEVAGSSFISAIQQNISAVKKQGASAFITTPNLFLDNNRGIYINIQPLSSNNPPNTNNGPQHIQLPSPTSNIQPPTRPPLYSFDTQQSLAGEKMYSALSSPAVEIPNPMCLTNPSASGLNSLSHHPFPPRPSALPALSIGFTSSPTANEKQNSVVSQPPHQQRRLSQSLQSILFSKSKQLYNDSTFNPISEKSFSPLINPQKSTPSIPNFSKPNPDIGNNPTTPIPTIHNNCAQETLNLNSNNDDSKPVSDYKFVDSETVLFLNDVDSFQNTLADLPYDPQLGDARTQWNPFANEQARLFYYNPKLKLVTDNLPFEKISPQQAAALAHKGVSFDNPGPQGLESVKQISSLGNEVCPKQVFSNNRIDNKRNPSEENFNKKTLEKMNMSSTLLNTSGDPYKELLHKHYKNYNQLYKGRTGSVDSINSGTSLASYMLIPFKYLDGIESLKSWSSIVSRIESNRTVMLKALETRDIQTVQHCYDVFTTLVAHVSYMSGVPPGTTPAFEPCNKDLSRAYRRMLTAMAKLSLSVDITKDKGTAFAEYTKNPTRSISVISSASLESGNSTFVSLYPERKFSVISKLSETGETDAYHLCSRDVNTIAKVTKMYITCFKGAAQSYGSSSSLSSQSVINCTANARRPSIRSQQSFGNAPYSPSLSPSTTKFSDPANDDSNSINSRGSIDSSVSLLYPVRQFRAGTWFQINVSPVSTFSSNTGLVTAPKRQSIVSLESYDSFIPLDHEVISVLDHQRTVVLSILSQIFSLIGNGFHDHSKYVGDEGAENQYSDSRLSAGQNPDNSAPFFQNVDDSNVPPKSAIDQLPNSVLLHLEDSLQYTNIPQSSPISNQPVEGDEKWTEDRHFLFVSCLNSLVSMVTNICNLLDSLDLSLYQPHIHTLRKKQAQTNSASPGSLRSEQLDLYSSQQKQNKDVHSTILLYDFLSVKQLLYDELLGFLYATRAADFESSNFRKEFALHLNSIKVSSALFPNDQTEEPDTEVANENIESSLNPPAKSLLQGTLNITSPNTKPQAPNLSASDIQEHSDLDEFERLIKARVMSIGISVDYIVTAATALANERPDLISDRPGSALDPAAPLDLTRKQSAQFPSSLSDYPVQLVTQVDSLDSVLEAQKNVGPSEASKEDCEYWYLKSAYANELIFDTENSKLVRGGTLRALIEHLTQHNSYDAAFNTAFLLTFRTMVHPSQLFKFLVERYGIQPPAGLSSEEFGIWTERMQKPVRFRVTNILKKWLTEYWFEDLNNPIIESLLKSMMDFTVELERQGSPGFKQVRIQLELKLQKDSSCYRQLVQNSPSKPPPEPILPKGAKTYRPSDLDPLELARQLCIREYNLFEQITPFECLTRRQSRSKVRNNTLEGTPHIDSFIQNSNCLTNWVCAMILSHDEPAKRAQAIEYYTNVAEYCRQNSNFSSMMAIISTISSATIHRLKKTWELVPEKTSADLDTMNKVMNSSRNFNEYRDILSVVSLPAVPFFGVYLTDLTFLEDANPDFLSDPDKKIINFSKRMKAADLVRDIMHYQSVSYRFKEVEEVQAALSNEFKDLVSLDEQYEISLKLEPREGMDDRVSKLLQQTGYL